MSTPETERVVALLVEDDDAVMEAMCSLLGEEYVVECVGSLLEARAVLRRRRIGIIVIDLMLRGEKGSELIEELAEREESPPVVLVSASPEAAIIAERFRISFVRKPFDIEDLLTTLTNSQKSHARPMKPR